MKTKMESEDQFTIDVVKSLHPLFMTTAPLNFSDEDELKNTKGLNISAIYWKNKFIYEYMYGGCTFNLLPLHCGEYMTPVLTDIGECMTFNSRAVVDKYNNITTFRAGVANGLQMQLNVAQYEYYTGVYSVGLKVGSMDVTV